MRKEEKYVAGDNICARSHRMFEEICLAIKNARIYYTRMYVKYENISLSFRGNRNETISPETTFVYYMREEPFITRVSSGMR